MSETVNVAVSQNTLVWMEEQAKIASQAKLRERVVAGEFQTGLGKEHIDELVKSGVLDEKIKRFGLTENNIGIVLGEAVESYKVKKQMEELQATKKAEVVVTPPQPSVIHQQPQQTNVKQDAALSYDEIYDPAKNKEYLETVPLADKIHISLMQKTPVNTHVTVTRL